MLGSLLDSNSGLANERDDDLIPPSEDDPLDIYEIDENSGDLTCAAKYTLQLEASESHYGGSILYRKFRLVRGGRSKVLNFIHYTAWPNRRMISNEDTVRLIELVNAKNLAGNSIFVNCLYGLGRTGTFIISREIYNAVQKENRSGRTGCNEKGPMVQIQLRNILTLCELFDMAWSTVSSSSNSSTHGLIMSAKVFGLSDQMAVC